MLSWSSDTPDPKLKVRKDSVANGLSEDSSITIMKVGSQVSLLRSGEVTNDNIGKYLHPGDPTTRIVNRGTYYELIYKPTWSVDISVDEVNKTVTLTPTLTNFIDGDRLSVSMLYPSGANGFIMSMLNNVDPVAFKLSLNNKTSWFTGSDQTINFTSSNNSAQTLYYDFVNAEEPKYKGNYTGKIRFEAVFTEAT